jgi:hypothetical protein
MGMLVGENGFVREKQKVNKRRQFFQSTAKLCIGLAPKLQVLLPCQLEPNPATAA